MSSCTTRGCRASSTNFVQLSTSGVFITYFGASSRSCPFLYRLSCPSAVRLRTIEVEFDVHQQRHLPKRRDVHLIREDLFRSLHRLAVPRVDVASSLEPRRFVRLRFPRKDEVCSQPHKKIVALKRRKNSWIVEKLSKKLMTLEKTHKI